MSPSNLLKIEKKTRNALMITAGAAVIVLFLLMPLEIYFYNAIFLSILPEHIFLPMAVLAFLLWLLIIIVAPMIFKGTKLNAVILLILGVTIASSIQSLFLNYNMVQLTGGLIHNSEINLNNVANLLIWLAIALSPLGLYVAKRKRSKKKDTDNAAESAEPSQKTMDSEIKQPSFEAGVIMISLLIVGIHAIGTITASITQPTVTMPDEIQGLSINQTFELSQDKNIVVFLIDRLDVKFMDEILELRPEIHEQLEGFTYFRNTVSAFTNTFPAVTTFLTNVHRKGDEDAHTFWDRAWSTQTFIDDLIQADYTIYLLPTLTSTARPANIIHRVDNFINPQDVQTTIEHFNILRVALRLTLNRIAPYLLKDIFLSYLPIDIGNRFITHEPGDFMPPTVGYTFDMMYYENLQTVKLSATNPENVFSFVHFYGMHGFAV